MRVDYQVVRLRPLTFMAASLPHEFPPCGELRVDCASSTAALGCGEASSEQMHAIGYGN